MHDCRHKKCGKKIHHLRISSLDLKASPARCPGIPRRPCEVARPERFVDLQRQPTSVLSIDWLAIRAQQEGDISQRHSGKVAKVATLRVGRSRKRPSVTSPTNHASAMGRSPGIRRHAVQFELFMLGEFPTVLEECFQTPNEGSIYVDLIDRLRTQGAIRRAEVDNSALVHTV